MTEKVELYRETELKDTEIGRIPKEWEVAGFNNIINTLYGFAFASEFFSEERGIPLIRIRDLGKNNTEAFYTGPYEEQYLVKRGDILVSMDGEFNVSLWRGPSGLLNQRVMKIWPICDEKLDVLYLYYASQKTLKSFEDQIAATTVKHLLTDHLQLIKIPLPSLQEQQKIAEILSTVDESIQKTDEVIAKTERLKTGLMRELLTKGIGHKEFKDTEIGKIPKEWEIKKLGEFLHLENGKRPNIVVNGKFPIYGANGIMGYTDAYMVDDDIVIIGRVGAAGEVHLAKGKIWLSDNAIYGINKNRTKIYLDFIYYVLKYTNLSRFASKTTHPIITQTILENFKVPVPPLAEQQKIAEILTTLDEKLENLRREKTKLERIKQWFMEELLMGRIRVRIA